MDKQAFLKQLLQAFRSETEERLASMSSHLLDLEQAATPANRAPALEVVYREAHSLKGAARAVGLTGIEQACQAMESLLSDLQKERYSARPAHFDLFHEAVRVIGAASTGEQDEGTTQRLSELTERLEALRLRPPSAVGPPPEAAVDAAAAPPTAVAPEAPTAERAAPPPVAVDVTGAASAAAAAPEPSASDSAVGAADERTGASEVRTPSTVRISAEKLDALLGKAEELLSLKLLAREQRRKLLELSRRFEQQRRQRRKLEADLDVLSRGVHPTAADTIHLDPAALQHTLQFLEMQDEFLGTLDRDLRDSVQRQTQDQRHLEKIVDDFLDDVKVAAMLPFATLLRPYPAMIRDISRASGKKIDFTTEGEDIEIDRRILEELRDVILHLLRNAADHGIEKPEERVRLGKPEFGRIAVAVTQKDEGQIELAVADDGRGLDPDRIVAAAVKLGVVSAEEADSLSSQSVQALIFRSGFSTSAMITDISGRGLGMAIIRERIERLGGTLAVENCLGQGLMFRIQLPVTLATFRGVLTEAGSHTFVIPSVHVQQVLRLSENSVGTVGNRRTLAVGERTLPLAALDRALALGNGSERGAEDSDTAVVLTAGGQTVAFIVDAVLGEQQVLVKSLGRQLKRVRNVSAVTVLGSGRIVPILHVHDLMRSALSLSETAVSTQGRALAKQTHTLLVVEDSVTSRMLLKNILEAAGYRVLTAVDGSAGLSLVRSEQVDAVVSDVEMPIMDGFELTAAIRQDKDLSDLPVVLVTSLSEDGDRARGIDVGANAYIVKSSFDQSNLLATIARLL